MCVHIVSVCLNGFNVCTTYSTWVDLIIMADDKDDSLCEQGSHCPRHQLVGLQRLLHQVKDITVHLYHNEGVGV